MLDMSVLISALTAEIPEVDFTPAFSGNAVSRRLLRPVVSINGEYESGSDGAVHRLDMLMYVSEGTGPVDCTHYCERVADLICRSFKTVTRIERKQTEVRDGYVVIPFSVTINAADRDNVSFAGNELPCSGITVSMIAEEYTPVCGNVLNAGYSYDIKLRDPQLTESQLQDIKELDASGYRYSGCRLKQLVTEHGIVKEALYVASSREVYHE